MRNIFIVLFLGFSSGLPLALTGGTLQAWLKDENIDLTMIGLLSAVSIPYSYKFTWAPILDSVAPLGLGRRRGWMLLSQIGLIAALIGMSFFSPASNITAIIFFAFAVSVLSATQDIAIDAYRRELLSDEELGRGAALAQLGYRIGMIASSGFALILADHFAWGRVYQFMAIMVLIGLVTTLLSPEEEREKKNFPTLEDFIEPFKEFISRSKWQELLLLVAIYKITDGFAMALTTPFLLEIGFTKTEIGTVLKIIGVSATIVGGLLAGTLMSTMSLKKALIYFGCLQLLANLAYAYLSIVGPDRNTLIIAVIIENLGSGLGTAAYVAFLMTITSRKFSGTQYALLTSLAALSRLAIQMPSGIIAQSIGWTNYFLLSVALGVPAVMLVIERFDKWNLSKK